MLFVCSLMAALYFAGPLRDFLDRRESFGSEVADDAGGTGRLLLFRLGMWLWEQAPILGHGPGQHPILLSRMFPSLPSNAAHNSITGALAETGVVGAGAIVTLYVGFVVQWVYAARRVGHYPIVVLAAGSAVAAAMFTGDIVISGGHIIALGSLAGVWGQILWRSRMSVASEPVPVMASRKVASSAPPTWRVPAP